jgi:hypothetical protein
MLHIGTEKTGTSTLQMLAAVNRKLLLANGVCYPLLPGDTSHVGLAIYAADPNRGNSLHAILGLRTRAAVAEFRDNFLERLGQEIDASGCDTILLSNEHLSSRASRPEHVLRIVQGLRTIAEEIRVFIYLRPQYELIVSGYSQAVKSGRTEPIDTGLSVTNHYFNYDRMLSYWESAVGIESITVRRFLKQQFVGGSLINDFFATLGIVLPPDIVIPPNRNISLDAETVEFLRCANCIAARRGKDGHIEGRRRLIGALEDLSKGPRITVPAEELAAIDEAFAAGNRRVNERYFPGSTAPLFPAFAGEGAGEIFTLTAERAVEIGIALWRESSSAAARKRAIGAAPGDWRRPIRGYGRSRHKATRAVENEAFGEDDDSAVN